MTEDEMVDGIINSMDTSLSRYTLKSGGGGG